MTQDKKQSICKDCVFTAACHMWAEDDDTDIYASTYGCERYSPKSEWVHLPCKVGDTAYFVTERNAPKGTKEHIVETTIEKIGVRKSGMFIKLSVNAMYETSCNSIGKTVFLTLEEAKKALAERSGK